MVARKAFEADRERHGRAIVIFSGHTGQVAVPERTDAAVTDYGDVSWFAWNEQVRKCGRDAPLRVDSALPAVDRLLRMREEEIREPTEFGSGQGARG